MRQTLRAPFLALDGHTIFLCLFKKRRPSRCDHWHTADHRLDHHPRDPQPVGRTIRQHHHIRFFQLSLVSPLTEIPVNHIHLWMVFEPRIQLNKISLRIRKIFNPLDGEVHSFQFNPGSGNYGPTIILYHPAEKIYSLYGHLSKGDLAHLEVGAPIAAGQLICHLGKPDENGGWPPHLHFQLIRDMQGFQGDYPGVCSQQDLMFYANNCPDPATF